MSLTVRGYSQTGALLSSEGKQPRYMRKKRTARGKNMVIRAPGGGRKSYVKFLHPGVKMWLNNMRSLGHWVDKADLVIEFESLAQEWLRRIKAKMAVEGLSDDEKVRKKKVEERLKGLDKKKTVTSLLTRSSMSVRPGS